MMVIDQSPAAVYHSVLQQKVLTMELSFSLNTDELRILGHAINWQLNGPFEHTHPPRLTEHEASRLLCIFNEICDLRRLFERQLGTVLVIIGEPCSFISGRLQLSPVDYQLMAKAVSYFFNEFRSSPEEITVVTGSHWLMTAELLSRLEAMYRPDM